LVIVADTSAWVEFLRGNSHPVGLKLNRLIEDGVQIAVTETIVMEVLAGARSARQMAALRSRLLAFPLLRLEGLADYEEAAILWRMCRAAGSTVRGFIDCLVAVPTIRAGAFVLHRDRDFDVIAEHTRLRVEPVT
jgi:predicted nucleic acid-binding protein